MDCVLSFVISPDPGRGRIVARFDAFSSVVCFVSFWKRILKLSTG